MERYPECLAYDNLAHAKILLGFLWLSHAAEIQPFIYGNLPFLYKIKILLARRLCHVITLQMLSPSPFLPLTFPMLMASSIVCPRESSFSAGRER